MKNPDADLRSVSLSLSPFVPHSNISFGSTKRFMALADLITDITRSGDTFGLDEQTEHSTVETMLSLMRDLNGEVKNMAVKA